MIILLLGIESEDDKEFIENLFKEYYPIMRSEAFKIVKNNFTANDIVNEAMIKLIKKIDVIKELNCYKLVTYIVVTIKNLSINYINKKENRIYFDELDDEKDDKGEENRSANSPDIIFIEKENKEEIHKLINKLPKKEQTLLMSKYILELDDKEIAEIVQTDQKNVRVYIARARKRALGLLKSKKEGV